MPRSFDEIKAILEKHDDKDLLSDINNLIESEKEYGKKSKSEANREAKNLRDRLQATEAKYTKVANGLKELGIEDIDSPDIDIEDFFKSTGELVKKVKSGKNTDDDLIKSSPAFKEIQGQFKKIQKAHEDTQKALDEERKKAQELQNRNIQNTLKSKLQKALTDDSGKSIMRGADLVIDNLIMTNKVKLKDDNETVIFVKGDDEIDFTEGLTSLKKERADLLINTQHPGGESTGKGGSNTGPKTDSDRLKELRAQRNRF